VDFRAPELERFAMQLDAIAGRLQEVCERLSVGVDPQGAGRRGLILHRLALADGVRVLGHPPYVLGHLGVSGAGRTPR
jgi:hypothetical protein